MPRSYACREKHLTARVSHALHVNTMAMSFPLPLLVEAELHTFLLVSTLNDMVGLHVALARPESCRGVVSSFVLLLDDHNQGWQRYNE